MDGILKLCIFYNKPKPYKKTEWFICKACMKKLNRGERMKLLELAFREISQHIEAVVCNTLRSKILGKSPTDVLSEKITAARKSLDEGKKKYFVNYRVRENELR